MLISSAYGLLQYKDNIKIRIYDPLLFLQLRCMRVRQLLDIVCQLSAAATNLFSPNAHDFLFSHILDTPLHERIVID